MNKEIKVIEAFAGYGSQRMALENIGYKISNDSGIIEWTADAIVAYASVHHGEELENDIQLIIKSYEENKQGLIDSLLSRYTLSSEKKKGYFINGEVKSKKQVSEMIDNIFDYSLLDEYLDKYNYNFGKQEEELETIDEKIENRIKFSKSSILVDKYGNESYVPLDESQYKRWPIEQLATLYASCRVSNNYGSIMDTKGDILNDIDLFTYSFPCQDLSLAGKMRGITETSRSGLLYQVERMLREQDADKRPKVLLMENVKNLVGKKFMPDFQRWLGVLDELGYTTEWKVLNAKEHGIPQNRERVFAVSRRRDTLPLLSFQSIFDNVKTKPLDLRLRDFLDKEVDESYYLSDEHIQRILGWNAYEKPLKKVLHKDSIDIGTITTRSGDDTSSQKLVIDNVDIIGNVSPSGHGQGGNVYSSNGLAPTFTENHGAVIKVQEVDNRIDVEEILNGKKLILGINPTSMTYKSDNIVHGENYYISTLRAGGSTQLVAVKDEVVIPLRIRKITPKEALRLMGVDDERIEKMTKYVTTKSAQYKLAGNSIVVQVLEDIFREINL